MEDKKDHVTHRILIKSPSQAAAALCAMFIEDKQR